MYKFILFDADDTLFDYNKGEAAAIKKSFEQFTLEYNEDYHLPIYRKHNSKVWLDYEKKLISADNLKVKRFADLFEEAGIETDPESFSKVYLSNLALSHYLFDGVTNLISEIAPKYKIAIITNGLKEVQYKRIQLSEISVFFDTVIVSEEAGAPKPEPRIFEYAFELAGHENKNNTLIVGDNLKSDILGGINYGIDTCWLNLKDVQNNSEIIPTYTIKHITELRNILL